MDNAVRTGPSTCNPSNNAALPTATSGRAPEYAGPPAAGNVATATASASNATGAAIDHRRDKDRPCTINAKTPPIRISAVPRGRRPVRGIATPHGGDHG